MFKYFTFIAVMTFMSAAFAADKPQQLTGDDLKTAVEMNKVYAQHMYSSKCVDNKKAMSVGTPLAQMGQEQLVATLKKTCDCMAEAILGGASPNDMIQYVTLRNGAMPPNVKREKLNANDATLVKKISALERNENTRKKCGIKQ